MRTFTHSSQLGQRRLQRLSWDTLFAFCGEKVKCTATRSIFFLPFSFVILLLNQLFFTFITRKRLKAQHNKYWAEVCMSRVGHSGSQTELSEFSVNKKRHFQSWTALIQCICIIFCYKVFPSRWSSHGAAVLFVVSSPESGFDTSSNQFLQLRVRFPLQQSVV